jgi:phosphinothricin acetyltransferase
MSITFRPIAAEDWVKVAAIYKQGIDTGNATFQQEIPDWTDWDKAHLKTCRILACTENGIAGWAALSPVSSRCVYAGVAEVSVYVSTAHQGKKIGTALLGKLITDSENEGIWTLQAGIFPENTASLQLHDRMGFRQVGYREKIGKMDNTWRNTVLLERRSKLII